MKKSNILLLIFLFCAIFFLGGCATLTYTGNDYNANNTNTVKTEEDFIFDVYKKSDGRINLNVGISKTPVVEILALYVQVENLSYETPYFFEVENLKIYNEDSNLQFITSLNYLSIWNAQEASSMSAMSSLGTSLQTMTGISANYNDYNQTIAQNNSEASKNSAFSRMDTLGRQITKHSIKHSATISPRRSQYFYFFFEDLDKYPITVKYNDMEYKFNL